jgi:glycosyltransferase involved in cell wall biosynthesis
LIVLLLIPSLGPGGAERVITLLADELAARNHQVTLLTLSEVGGDFFPVSPRVRRVGLGLMGDSRGIAGGLVANVRRVRAIRRTVSGLRPDAVVSFLTDMNVLAIAACSGLSTRIVVSERIDPQSYRPRSPWSLLRKLTYGSADAIVVQTNESAEWYRHRFRRTHIVAIPNPVVVESETSPPEYDARAPFVLAAGRLVHQKGFDLLIRAFANVTQTHPDLRLRIAGEGPEESVLLEMIADLRLSDRVFLIGRVANLRSLLRQAVAFVLPSRFEGFPNVLLEALSTGTPIVSTNCPGGPSEILCDGKFGMLVPSGDPAALADAIGRMVRDSKFRAQFVSAGPEAVARYAPEKIVAKWEHVLGEPSSPDWT